jgi:hypothetical protein
VERGGTSFTGDRSAYVPRHRNLASSRCRCESIYTCSISHKKGSAPEITIHVRRMCDIPEAEPSERGVTSFDGDGSAESPRHRKNLACSHYRKCCGATPEGGVRLRGNMRNEEKPDWLECRNSGTGWGQCSRLIGSCRASRRLLQWQGFLHGRHRGRR